MNDTTSYDQKPTEKKSVDVYPVKKGKRSLVYLCDLLISFFFAFVIYSTAVVPLSELAVNFKERQTQNVVNSNKRDAILEENALLFKQFETQSLEGKVSYTCEQYARYVSESNYTELSPDIFHQFYFVTRADYTNKFISEVKKCDTQGYFAVNESLKLIELKAEYKEIFKQGFAPDGGFTTEGKAIYDTFYRTYFLNMYGEMLNDIKQNDLSSTNPNKPTYNEYQRRISEFVDLFKGTVVVDSFIAFFIGIVVSYLIVPLCNKNHRTISMIFMRVTKVNKNNFEIKSNGSVVMNLVYQIATNAWMVFFVPLISVSFDFLFSLPVIVPLSIASLLIVIASLFILLFDEYNRPLSDRFANTIMISTDTLDDIYHARGYL